MIPQNSAIDNIKTIIKSERIPHSFMLEGGKFEERLETAKFLAKAIICEGENKPCDICKMCRTADSSSNPDIIIVEPEDDKKYISVDRIRKLRADAFVMPHSAQKKVFIIPNAELMNEQAQNALLKVLEEPPKSVAFILLTPSRTLELVTIVSRCSIFMLSAENSDDIKLDDEAKEIISLIFDGKNYDILKIFKKYEKDRQKAEKLFRSIGNQCVKAISDEGTSNYRKKILSKIYDKTALYIDMIRANVNMLLLLSAVDCDFRMLINM